MQYGNTAFGKTQSDGTLATTMESISDASETLGAASHMNANDLGKINAFYGCSDAPTCKLNYCMYGQYKLLFTGTGVILIPCRDLVWLKPEVPKNFPRVKTKPKNILSLFEFYYKMLKYSENTNNDTPL